MSVYGSVPTRLAKYVLLSLVVTSISDASLITWSLVIIYPSGETITPDPFPILLGVDSP